MFAESTLQMIELAVKADPKATTSERNAILGLMKNPVTNGVDDRLISIKDAAGLLSIHEKSVWRLIHEERLHVIPIGQKCRRVRMSEVEAIMNGSFVPSRSYAPTNHEA